MVRERMQLKALSWYCPLYLSSDAFKKMKRLRLLILHNVILLTTIEYLPTELRVIDWPGYQFPTLPLNPGPKQLVILNMPNSHIQQLGEGFKKLESLLLRDCNLSEADFLMPSNGFDNLKILWLGGNKFVSLPSLKRFSNIGLLFLGNCEFLRKIPKLPPNLRLLYATNCKFLLETYGNFLDKVIRDKEGWLLVHPDISLNSPFHLLEADFLLAPSGFDNLERLLLEDNKLAYHRLRGFINPINFFWTTVNPLGKFQPPGNLMLLGASD
ncbi:hypothetical protein FEM48_Zijuj05G0166900 [Ziziphus jujuba var. spinosa]|uniref:Uncharacterized protein n=1 Tax=Ziziphus jujuba var. spinosa TaxID=714518 RepID=A0A978VFY4_ZIZJJ|nr:hypothetical protein FEM48_Zijuj05G0166900 [Ziziphus jujuba var. spinosa]